MKHDPEDRRLSIGLLPVRDHGAFTWFRPSNGDQRDVHVLADHREECISEVRRRGYDLIAKPGDKATD
jgi:hypothetical protein